MQDTYKGDRTDFYPWMKTANHVGKQTKKESCISG